ncbi:DHB14-like protein, partial [Mya arenaria]
GGITSLTKALAKNEAKHGVRLIDRLCEPREIGLACLYLAVDATFTTGFELNCSAGAEIGYGVKM